jgi:hypothetical protein
VKRLLFRLFRVGEPEPAPPYDPKDDPLLPRIRQATRQVVLLRDRLP